MIKVLWLAPNFNHYKARFLNHLANDNAINLTILSGTGRNNMGDQELEEDWSFKYIKLNVSKKDFGNSKKVKEALKPIFKEFDWVLIPAEKKNLQLFLYAMKLRYFNKSVRLFSYNHPILKSKKGRVTFIDKLLTKFYYKNLDRVIFYTQYSYEWAINNRLINLKKAFWANNTIDNIEIDEFYTYGLPPETHLNLLFIGRLIASKRLDELLIYYYKIKEKLPNLKLEIIGDGPEKGIVNKAAKKDENIICHGTLINEKDISPIMERCSMVFIPGHSGLSINHAFAYGRPYVTLKGPSHAPELNYIVNGKNGYVLDEDYGSNIDTIINLLTERTVLKEFCEEAKKTGSYLSVQNWVQQIKSSLLHES